MNARRVVAALLVQTMMVSGPGLLQVAGGQPAPAGAPASGAAQAPVQVTDATPARVSYLYGEVSFRRPEADGWAPARLNTPLAPGDAFYTGQGGNVEIQIEPRAFVRAGDGRRSASTPRSPTSSSRQLTAPITCSAAC